MRSRGPGLPARPNRPSIRSTRWAATLSEFGPLRNGVRPCCGTSVKMSPANASVKMSPMDLVLMGNRDARRLGLVQAAVQGRITSREGAESLGMSVRQFKRLRARVREGGVRGLVHGNRGRPSTRRLPETTLSRIRELLTGTIKINDHHLAEWVSEEGHPVSAASVRRERRRLQLAPKRRRRPARYHRRRERAARRGALVLIDGSPFTWFTDATHYQLMGAVDDATGEILALHFRPHEDLHGFAQV